MEDKFLNQTHKKKGEHNAVLYDYKGLIYKRYYGTLRKIMKIRIKIEINISRNLVGLLSEI